jgi:hypothetical protein
VHMGWDQVQLCLPVNYATYCVRALELMREVVKRRLNWTVVALTASALECTVVALEHMCIDVWKKFWQNCKTMIKK